MLSPQCFKRGFSLIEILVVLAIAALIMSLSVGSLKKLKNQNSSVASAQQIRSNLNLAQSYATLKQNEHWVYLGPVRGQRQVLALGMWEKVYKNEAIIFKRVKKPSLFKKVRLGDIATSQIIRPESVQLQNSAWFVFLPNGSLRVLEENAEFLPKKPSLDYDQEEIEEAFYNKIEFLIEPDKPVVKLFEQAVLQSSGVTGITQIYLGKKDQEITTPQEEDDDDVEQ